MNNSIFQNIIFFILIIIMSKMSTLYAQKTQKNVGDIYVFPDGSRGIVCYVDPDNELRGWVVALNDVEGTYPLWAEGDRPSGLNNSNPEKYNIYTWLDNGKKNTKILIESGRSPAAEAVDFYNGWYIPDVLQMRTIFGYYGVLKKAVEKAGGDFASIINRHHWSSSTVSTTQGWVISTAGHFSQQDAHKKYYIRPVRDFGDKAEAYWEDPYKADSTKTGSMKVSPKVTTAYDAVVTYGKDHTFHLKLTAIPCPTYDKDTLYELACRDSINKYYDSKKDSHFTNLWVDTVTNGYAVYRDTLQTVKGCDSVITLMLMVVDGCENLYTDSLCPIEISYSILDTTFLPGTISGIYERPGKKFAGGLWIDTVSYIDLTIYTPPTVSINNLVETCPLVGSQTLGATITDGKAPYTYTWSTVGTGITLSDASIPAPTVTIPTKCGTSYTIKLDVTDGNGCKAKQAVKVVTVKSTEAPVINTTFASADLGCNPGTITAPTFTVTDACEGSFALPADSITVTGPTHTGCNYTQSWTAHYTDACGKKAKDSTITYSWTQTTVPTISTALTDKTLGCASAVVAPTVADFTVSDDCNPSAVVTLVAGPETMVGTEHSRTWTASYQNSCGQIATPVSITYKWVDAPSLSITCPPDISDTLSFGDCTMKINPTKLSLPTVDITPASTPYGISSDFPSDSLFGEGSHVIKWVVLDSVCGYKDSCQQHLLVVFPQCPDAVDCEGNVYHGIRIGCDCWTQRNLESTKYSDCTDIPCVYEYVSDLHPDVTENVKLYGRLYCYEGAIRDSADNGYGHIQGICPAGWYLPTPEKYEELGSHGVPALKHPSYWIIADGTNTTGFSALPAGFFSGSTGRFEGLLGETYFWSVSGTGASTKITVCAMFFGCHDIIFVPIYTGMGYSVRCIKEKE